MSPNGSNAFVIKLNPDAKTRRPDYERDDIGIQFSQKFQWSILIHPPCSRVFVFRIPVITSVFSGGFVNNSRPRIVAQECTTFAPLRGGMTRSMTVMTILFSSSWKYSFLACGGGGGDRPFRMGELIANREAQKEAIHFFGKKKERLIHTHTKSELDISLIFNQSYASHRQLASMRPSSCSPPNHSSNPSTVGLEVYA